VARRKATRKWTSSAATTPLPRALERAPLAQQGGRRVAADQHVAATAARTADRRTKTEVKAEIEKRIGLSFEQFTRAVLLAQNEFRPSSRPRTMNAANCWKR
jgi:hypothetical protein